MFQNETVGDGGVLYQNETIYLRPQLCQITQKEEKMFLPKGVYYEKDAESYELGKRLLKQYRDNNVPCIEIENHNNIEEMRAKPNSEFKNMKQNIIIGVRKTHKFMENHKVSDYLVPYTSSRLYSDVFILLFSL